MKKPRAFWLHYNKPESARRGRNVLTIHQSGVCHLVEDIDCRVPIKTRTRKQQPRCVLAGRGVLNIVNGVGIITPA